MVRGSTITRCSLREATSPRSVDQTTNRHSGLRARVEARSLGRALMCRLIVFSSKRGPPTHIYLVISYTIPDLRVFDNLLKAADQRSR